MNRPILSFYSNIAPYQQLTSLVFTKTKGFYSDIPTVNGEITDEKVVRIYNNWAQAVDIATAYNIHITTYDRAGTLAASGAVASQHWMAVKQIGYGEGSSRPGPLTSLEDEFVSIGGSKYYIPIMGSDGLLHPIIRAGIDFDNMGFIELKSYMTVPKFAVAGNYSFILTVGFNWVP
jgi:hypothetical protein